MLPKNVLYYGSDQPPPERTPLRAGPLSLIYEAGDLRYVRLEKKETGAGPEILRRVYVAVRDQNWGTVLPSLSNVRMEISEDSFHIAYDVEHVEGDVDFSWRGTITGDAQGTVRFTMDGVARSTFLRNRIGFCVLHPMTECAGQPCRVEKVDGTVEEGAFPAYISPHQPFFEMRAISHQVVPGVWAKVSFEGDVFEMEDQRNWTDASFKTYCTPLGLPFPVEIPAGTRISQTVTLTLDSDKQADKREKAIKPSALPELTAPAIERDATLTFSVGAAPVCPLPHVGLCVADDGQSLSQIELARLRALNLSHLRVDLKLSQPGYADVLRHAVEQADALGLSLEVALHLSGAADEELASLRDTIADTHPLVCRWLVFHSAGNSTGARWASLARQILGDYEPQALIGGGTDAFFTELNRARPPVDVLDLVAYSLNPQVHAFDNASLVETLEAQAATVDSARQFCGGLPIAVSPITFKMRHNPNATAPETETGAVSLPPQVDVRQMSLFGAAWTAGSLKYIAESGAHSATYYQTRGWLGVMETEAGSPLPGVFRSVPGGVFPLYHVLADVGEFSGGDVLPTTSSAPLCIDGLAMRDGERTRVVLVNLNPQAQRAMVMGLGRRVSVSRLDETNVMEAMRAPRNFRAQQAQITTTNDGTLELEILPYGLVRIDSA